VSVCDSEASDEEEKKSLGLELSKKLKSGFVLKSTIISV
jgi:hypothetical protein